jgi:hypothetical protein
MKLDRLLVSAFAGWMLLNGACGPEEIRPLDDPKTFSYMSRAKIEGACQKTVACDNTPAQYEGCVVRTSNLLETDAMARLNFLTNYARCSSHERCEFVTCTKTPQAYGESQRPKVTYTCQQSFACDMLAGRASDPQVVDYCTAESVGFLDTLAGAKRADFERVFGSCQAMTACEFAACFKY